MNEPSDVDDIKQKVESICKRLNNEKALIVFGRTEILDYAPDSLDRERFGMLVSELIRKTSVKIVITMCRPLGLPDIEEQYFKLGPLNLAATVKLFAYLSSSIGTRIDPVDFFDRLVKNSEEGQLLFGPDIPTRTRFLFTKLGYGIPSLIQVAALSMKDNDIQNLLEM